MSVNFNPGAYFGPAQNVDYKKDVIKTNKGQNAVNTVQERPRVDNSKNTLSLSNYTTAEIDILTAAAIIAKAKILKAQEMEPIPVEIVTAASEANRAYGRAMATAVRVLDNVEKIQAGFEFGDEIGKNGEILREISEPDEDGTQTMLEFGPGGEIIRKSEFKDGIPQKIEEFREDGAKNVIKFFKGEIDEYSEGVRETEKGTKRAKYMTFSSKSPIMYCENYEEFNAGGSNTSVGVAFDKGRMTAYYENMQCFEDFSSLIGLHLRYDNKGVLYEYAKNIGNDFDKGLTIEKRLLFEDEKWVDRTEE